jgi:hypothetical protein
VRRPLSNSSAYLLVAVPLATMCLACTALASVSQVFAARLDQATGAVTPMCAWARNGSLGLWWSARVPPARAFANAHRYNAVCLALPWSPHLPASGRPAVDMTP